MRLENVQNRSKNDQNRPLNVENQVNWPKNIPKVCKLLQNSYSGQKARDLLGGGDKGRLKVGDEVDDEGDEEGDEGDVEGGPWSKSGAPD